MPFFVVDDGAHSHRKVMAATNAAMGLWVRVGSWVTQQLTDGHVPGDIAKMYGTAPQISKLVAAGLWHKSGHDCPRCPQLPPGDYYMHDYRESGNPSRAEVLDRRKRAAEKKRKHRAGEQLRGRTQGDTRAGQQAFDDEPPSDPAQPEDSGPPPAPTPRRAPGPAPSLISHDWEPSHDDVQAVQIARHDDGRAPLNVDQLDAVTRKFVRRMRDDGRTAAAWGGRWRQWAENERTEQQATPGGVVVHLPTGRGPGAHPQSTADQRAAAAFDLANKLRAEGNQ